MHFYLVCNMNKIGRVFVLCILIFAKTGADELISKRRTSTTTIKWKEPTTTPKLTNVTAKNEHKAPSTTINHKVVRYNNKPKIPTTTISSKEPIIITNHNESSAIFKWKQPTTTTKRKETITSKVPSARSTSHTPINHRVVAVASFPQMDNRNKRLSSMEDVKIFPASQSSIVKTDDKGNFFLKSINGKISSPITITKQGDGVSGTIRILPGSISVSSSASSQSNSGPVSAVASYSPWRGSIIKPMMTDLYFPPFPTFPTLSDPMFDTRFQDARFQTKMLDPFPFMRMPEPSFKTRTQEPWYDKEMFKKPRPKQNVFTPNWLYPSFNPFINYW